MYLKICVNTELNHVSVAIVKVKVKVDIYDDVSFVFIVFKVYIDLILSKSLNLRCQVLYSVLWTEHVLFIHSLYFQL